MTSELKQSELQRNRTIIMATLDYLEERLGGSFVYDQYDPVKEYYQQQKAQTERYFKQQRLDRLQQQLASLSKGLQNRADLNFASYMKEKTGYDVDIFEDFRKHVDAIVAQNEIRNHSELTDIVKMLHISQQRPAKGKDIENLKSLLTDYAKRTNKTISKSSGEYSQILSRVEKDGIVKAKVRISKDSKPKHYEEQWADSPDGKRKLLLAQWSDGKQASTYVALHFPTSSGAVYGTNGIHPDIKAWWKDNSTIVVETKREYQANTQSKQVQSFGDVITIEYIED